MYITTYVVSNICPSPIGISYVKTTLIEQGNKDISKVRKVSKIPVDNMSEKKNP
jgi:hypothetical protein